MGPQDFDVVQQEEDEVVRRQLGRGALGRHEGPELGAGAVDRERAVQHGRWVVLHGPDVHGRKDARLVQRREVLAQEAGLEVQFRRAEAGHDDQEPRREERCGCGGRVHKVQIVRQLEHPRGPGRRDVEAAEEAIVAGVQPGAGVLGDGGAQGLVRADERVQRHVCRDVPEDQLLGARLGVRTVRRVAHRREVPLQALARVQVTGRGHEVAATQLLRPPRGLEVLEEAGRDRV